MHQKEIRKRVRAYKAIYGKALNCCTLEHVEERLSTYEKRLTEMYASEKFSEHNIFPTMNVTHIYAVIAMCLELKDAGMSDVEVIRIINMGFERRRNFFKRIIAVINMLPNSFDIARKWNISGQLKVLSNL